MKRNSTGLVQTLSWIVQGNKFEVLGQSFVAIYDSGLWEEGGKKDTKLTLPNQGKFFLLKAGDKYDLEKREVYHWNGSNREISINR